VGNDVMNEIIEFLRVDSKSPNSFKACSFVEHMFLFQG